MTLVRRFRDVFMTVYIRSMAVSPKTESIGWQFCATGDVHHPQWSKEYRQGGGHLLPVSVLSSRCIELLVRKGF